jgi:hypothetical protein
MVYQLHRSCRAKLGRLVKCGNDRGGSSGEMFQGIILPFGLRNIIEDSGCFVSSDSCFLASLRRYSIVP